MPKKVIGKNTNNPISKRKRVENLVEDESDSSESGSQTEQLINLVNSINNTVITLAADQSKNHAELKANVFHISEKIDSVIKRVEAVEQTVKVNQSKIANHDKEFEKLKIELRKLNLIVVGLADEANESDQKLRLKLQTLISEKLTQSEVIIDNAYRLGKPRQGYVRPIMLKFRYESHRNLVWDNRNNLRTPKTNIFINEDLPPATQNKRRILRDECSKLFKLGHTTRLLGDKLFIDSVCYELDDDNTLIQSRIPSYNRKTKTGPGRNQTQNEGPMETSGSSPSNYVNVGSFGSSGSSGIHVYGNSETQSQSPLSGSSSGAFFADASQNSSQPSSQVPLNEDSGPDSVPFN